MHVLDLWVISIEVYLMWLADSDGNCYLHKLRRFFFVAIPRGSCGRFSTKTQNG